MDSTSHQTLQSEKPSYLEQQQHHPHSNTNFHPHFNSQNQPHSIFQSNNSPRYQHPTQPINQLNQSINSMNVHMTYKSTSNVDVLRYIKVFFFIFFNDIEEINIMVLLNF